MKKHFHTILFIILSTLPLPLLLMNCARESTPVGGLKDTTEPKILWEKPINNSKNSTPKKIIIKFDESITLDKIQDNCIISPPFEKNPSITARKNKVIIDLSEQSLKANSTYSFTFTNAIKDLNEGNILEKYTYAFSNYSQIDTLKIKGKVRYAHNLEIPSNAYVLLYDNLSDSACKTQKPRYISQIKKDGSFLLENIASGSYKIYALEDANKDFMFNQAIEKIAFLDSTITPFASSFIDTVWYQPTDTVQKDSFSLQTKTRWSHQNLSLFLFENISREQTILNNKRLSKYAYGWKWSNSVTEKDFTISIPGFSTNSYFMEFLPKNDSVIIWLRDTSLINSVTANMLVKNTHSLRTDTLTIAYTKDLPARLSCDAIKASTTAFKGDSVKWTVSRPIDQNNTNKIQLFKVKDTICLKNSSGKIYQFNADKNPIVLQQLNPQQKPFVPKFFYEKQEILSYKTGLNRFALYFSKPFNPKDIIITLQGFPELQNWYVSEYDISTNSLLCWITNPDAMKLKNPGISVTYFTNGKNGNTNTKRIDFEPGISFKDSYKTIKTGKLLAIVSDYQKNDLYLDNVIEIICNNPILSFTDSLFSLIEVNDSLNASIITGITKSLDSQRKLIIKYNAKPGKIYLLYIGKNAITDIYKNTNKNSEISIKTQKENSSTIYTVVEKTIIKIPEKEREYALTADWKEDTKYAIVIPSGTYTDIYGAENDSCLISITCPKIENYGTLTVNTINTTEKLCLQLQLKDSKKSEILYSQFQSKQGTFFFQNINPGEYVLSAFIDSNKNNTWDGGSLEEHKQPEKIEIFTKSIVIKANWDNTIEWNFKQ